MPKVLVLPDHIASQIAAGEVVERPASVVKEMVENSIDAGATQIEVSIGANCRDIRIADNGCGMEPEDAVLAFQRHATSKIRSVDDLWKLTSLGFRGEALPSIASVSKITCFTRTRESQSGSRIESADGKASCVETGCAPGTIMEINDLFYNVPARLSFLKRASTELGHIEETLQSLAIAHPSVAFHMLSNNQTAFKTSGSGDLALAVAEAGLFSGNEALCHLDYTDSRSGLHVFGEIARPLHFRGDRKGILSIVNKRPVRCHLTYKALDYAFSDLIPRGRYPLAVVSISINPEKVDVNIHPTKKEIKYSNGNDVYLSIQRALTQALRQERELSVRESFPIHNENVSFDPVEIAIAGKAAATVGSREPEFSVTARDFDRNEPLMPLREGQMAREREARTEREAAHQISFREELAYAPPARLSPRTTTPSGVAESYSTKVPETSYDAEYGAADHSQSGLPDGWRVAGYLHNTYIILETLEGMMIVEQHIAHERTLYERILAAQTTRGRISDNSQRLIVSAPLALSPGQLQTLRSSAEALKTLGFEFELEPDSDPICSEVPLELAGEDYVSVVHQLLSDIATAESADIELEATKSLACQAAIKNGMPLGPKAINKLLIDWHGTSRNDTCPHGRPIALSFSKDKLFQLFHPA